MNKPDQRGIIRSAIDALMERYHLHIWLTCAAAFFVLCGVMMVLK